VSTHHARQRRGPRQERAPRTFHRLKGLEFKRIIIAAANEGEIPLRHPTPFASDKSRKDYEEVERCLLYVAATRARDQLTITSYGSRVRGSSVEENLRYRIGSRVEPTHPHPHGSPRRSIEADATVGWSRSDERATIQSAFQDLCEGQA